MRFAKLFWNSDAIREANATYKKRMAEINEKAAIDSALIELEKEANKESFKAKIRQNNAQLKEAWSK